MNNLTQAIVGANLKGRQLSVAKTAIKGGAKPAAVKAMISEMTKSPLKPLAQDVAHFSVKPKVGPKPQIGVKPRVKFH